MGNRTPTLAYAQHNLIVHAGFKPTASE